MQISTRRAWQYKSQEQRIVYRSDRSTVLKLHLCNVQCVGRKENTEFGNLKVIDGLD